MHLEKAFCSVASLLLELQNNILKWLHFITSSWLFILFNPNELLPWICFYLKNIWSDTLKYYFILSYMLTRNKNYSSDDKESSMTTNQHLLD